MSELVLENEKMLPNGWTKCVLDELAFEVNSGFPSGKHNKAKKGIPHLRPMNIDYNGNINMSEVKYVETNDYDALRKGDVLFNNTNSPKLLGKTAVIKQDMNWAYSNHMTRIRFDTNLIQPLWLAYYLHKLFWEGYYKIRANNHVNQSSINSTYLSTKVPILIAPLNEQKRIVSKIEELFSIIYNLKNSLIKIETKTILNFEAILNDAFHGKLTKQWREHNKFKDSSLLLKKIKTKQSKIGRRLKRSQNVISFKKYDLPENWIWTDIFSISKDLGDAPFGTNLKSKDYVNKGIPVIHGRNIKKNRFYWKYPLYVSKEKFDSLERSHCHTGELIFQKIGSVGTIAILPKIEGKISFLLSTNAMKVSTDPKLVSIKYLYYYFYQNKIKQFIGQTAQGTSQPIFNFSTLKNFSIPLPPTEEQYKIIELVDQFSSELSNITKLMQFLVIREDVLIKKILEFGFKGELVPQDPNDEPAETLLQKIKQEKEKLEQKQKIIKAKSQKKRKKNVK